MKTFTHLAEVLNGVGVVNLSDAPSFRFSASDMGRVTIKLLDAEDHAWCFTSQAAGREAARKMNERISKSLEDNTLENGVSQAIAGVSQVLIHEVIEGNLKRVVKVEEG